MKLYISTTSPFARKVRMLVQILSLSDRVVIITANPFEDADLRKVNPLGKIPAFSDGELHLFDSDLICQYLIEKESKKNGVRSGAIDLKERFTEKKLNTLINGITDAAVSTVFEARRDDSKPSIFWLARWDEAIHSSLSYLNNLDSKTFYSSEEEINLKEISLAATLAYLDFRRKDLEWRNKYPALAEWIAVVEQYEWFTSTAPQ